MAAPIDHRVDSGKQIQRGREMCFVGLPRGVLARTERLDLAIAQQIEQLETVGEAHVPHIIAGLGEIL
jgi:hypothetical protein